MGTYCGHKCTNRGRRDTLWTRCADKESGDDHFSVSTNITTDVTRYFLKLTKTYDANIYPMKYLYKMFISLIEPHLQSGKMELYAA